MIKTFLDKLPKVSTGLDSLFIKKDKVTVTLTSLTENNFSWKPLGESIPNYSLNTRWLGYFIWLWFQVEISVDK
jgi:hypothetical protein